MEKNKKKIHILYDFFLNLFYPTIIILKLLSKFYKIKIGNITPFRIGHLVGELSLWYLENQSDKKSIQIWYVSKNVCNKFFINKIKEKIKISNNFFIKILFDTLKKFNKKEFLISGPTYGERDLKSLIYKNPDLINFTPEETKYGNKILDQMGIKDNDKIVCMCIRDNFFFEKVLKTKNYKKYEFKNSNIENYNKAVKYLNENNIKVIRMGVGSEKEWTAKNGINFDYSLSKYRSDFMDFYLVSKSKFVITNGTGFYWIPYILKKPLVMADFTPIGGLCSYVPNSIHIFKHLYFKKEKRRLNLKELVSEEFNFFYSADDYQKKELDLIDNTPDEILECVLQMNSFLDGEEIDELDAEIQKKFWNFLPNRIEKYLKNNKTHEIINAKIGNKFLKKYI